MFVYHCSDTKLWGVWNQWNGMVEWNTGMGYWNGSKSFLIKSHYHETDALHMTAMHVCTCYHYKAVIENEFVYMSQHKYCL